MTQRFQLPRGTLVSPIMSGDYLGALVSIRYFNGGGAEIVPTVEARLTASRDAAGTIATSARLLLPELGRLMAP